MLILLPPSEGKTAPRRGAALVPDALGFPTLTEPRERVLDALIRLCRADADQAASTLGLGPTQADLISRNADLREAPTARADRVYTGVLYDALGFASLSPAARRRAASRVAITSALFGVVRTGDRIPAYRLSGDASLPGLGSVAGLWRQHLGSAVTTALGPRGLLLDLRSTAYAAFWRPPAELTERVATVRVLHETGGRRSVVSHFNKATKGRLVRGLLEEGDVPSTPGELADALSGLGWDVELGAAERHGTRVDVVVTEVG